MQERRLAQLPGFKNQGDCVSFVATRGRNRPAGPRGVPRGRHGHERRAPDRRRALRRKPTSRGLEESGAAGAIRAIDGAVAIGDAVESAETQPEPVRLLGWL